MGLIQYFMLKKTVIYAGSLSIKGISPYGICISIFSRGRECVRKRRIFGNVLWAVSLLFVSGCALLPEREVLVPWMTKEDLKGRLGSAELIVLDVRKKPDWDASGRTIPGAIHEDYQEVKEWAGKYPRDKIMVLYCA